MSFATNLIKALGVSKKKEEFSAFSIIDSMGKAVDSKRTDLKDRQTKLAAELKKAEEKVAKIKEEQALIKFLLAETA